MKDISIQKFWTKLMTSSKSVNKIPDYYLKYAQNARIYDGWIWPAKWKQLLVESTLWTNNKGAFTMNGKLYQITNGKIYEINESDGTRTEIDDIWYDAMTDTLVYSFPRWDFTSLWTDNETYELDDRALRVYYDAETNRLRFFGEDNQLVRVVALTTDNSWYAVRAIKIIKANSDWDITRWNWFDAWDWIILLDGQFASMNLLSGSWYEIEVEVWYYVSTEKAIIASNGRDLTIFDWVSVSTVNIENTWIIEFCRGFSFLSNWNILNISRPITITNPEYAYDFTGTGSEQIIYKSDIKGLLSTMNWLYVFTTDTVEFLWANSLQNVAWSATFISTPLWESGELMNQFSLTSHWDKIFYLTKNKKIKTVNYIWGTASPSIWDLSSRDIVSMDEYLNWIDLNQETCFAFVNKKDTTVQFHVRLQNAWFNNVCIIYDIINDTWVIDKWKYYNYVVEKEDTYYGFSDINDSVYIDDEWYSMAWSAIPFTITTQEMNQNSMYQKLYGWFFTAGAIWPFTELKYRVLVCWDSVFMDTIQWSSNEADNLWEIGWNTIGWEPIGWDLTHETTLTPFDRVADEWRIFNYWNRISLTISSPSQIQEFLIDVLWVRAEISNNIDISNKF